MLPPATGKRAPAPTRDRLPVPLRRCLITSAIASGLFLVVLLFSDRGLPELLRLDREIQVVEDDIATLEGENARLEEEIARLDRPGFRVERIAREELGLVRPGEVVLLLPAEDDRGPADLSQPDPNAGDASTGSPGE